MIKLVLAFSALSSLPGIFSLLSGKLQVSPLRNSQLFTVPDKRTVEIKDVKVVKFKLKFTEIRLNNINVI